MMSNTSTPNVYNSPFWKRYRAKYEFGDSEDDWHPKYQKQTGLIAQDSSMSIMKRLPNVIGQEILSYLLPKNDGIEFRNHMNDHNDHHGGKYQKACIYRNDQCIMVKNRYQLYLSRICKKNGRHRYYISKKISHLEETCRDGHRMYEYYYKSAYVGRDIQYALFTLMNELTELPAKITV